MKFTIPALAATLLLSSAAFAQDAAPPKGPDFAARHTEMCQGHYAHAVGKLAELEVRLKLTSMQKPLFERWKNVKLANAKANSAKCADMKMPVPGERPSLLEMRQRHIAMLESRLADMKAETPSLEAFVKSLDEAQVKILTREAHEARGRFFEHRGPMGHGPMGQGPMGMMNGPHHPQHAMLDGGMPMGADD
ncbi:hypothetical protein FHS83_000982 [Rhizomicrobium palustre]|uniref:LTXXQ motif family protein n=1 Tax=Rhizomicrobium palustre TaxID=189966 RepID=A0A846MVY4_9PROT|nr:Spy/CpxP family protein refolding chaperone [Rhizomicrobium palustre]NIK87664.1 hypothetical protein [Rhizomicrobium palustre]